MSGYAVATYILQKAGINDISVKCIGGKLTDRFDPIKKCVFLSSDVYNGTNIAAIGIAAHETGHALQYAAGYAPLRIRMAIVGITNFSSRILYFIIILSFIAQIPALCNIAVICFLVIFIFQLITLPVEFNASARAVECINNLGYSDSDIKGVKKILSAAAMTYVAAMLVSLGQMLMYMFRIRDRK